MAARYKVVLDAGHGGKDPGAIGPSRLVEKDVTLAVVLKIDEHLRQHGVQTMLTRAADQDVSLNDRCRISNNFAADVFLSVHCNSATNPAAGGMEVWTSRGQTAGDKLADILAQELRQAFPNLRLRSDLTDGDLDKEADFQVLKYTRAPAALVELAFISNPAEEKLLASPEFQGQAAEALAKGVLTYLGITWQEAEKGGKEKMGVFRDVPDTHWAKASIERLANLGIFKGDDQGRFNPDKPITRAEIAVVLDRVLKLLGK
jgi:N-acetylmuramoyl-L-alanine amidase